FDYEPRSEEKANDNGEGIKLCGTSYAVERRGPSRLRLDSWYGRPAELVEELSHHVNSTSTSQVAEDTVSLLMAMGTEAHAYLSSTALADWTASEAGTELQRWKRKLKTAFGVGAGRQTVARPAEERLNPENIPLPRTPKKTIRAVFGSAEQSPYFHDSHMVTPRSESRKARVAREAEQTESTPNTRPGTGRSSSRRQAATDDSSSDEDNPFYQEDDENDATTELAWQIRELTAMEEMDPTPRFEIAQHRLLGKVTPFRGKLNESESSMQWLRGFVYKLKALSRKTKRTWSLLSDKFISYYCSQFSQLASTRYHQAKWSEKEHIRDYLNRLNGYARNRDLERQLTPMQLRHIHTLEDIVSDIQKVEKRVSNRSSSQSSSRRDDKRHTSSSGSYGRHDSRSRSQERSRSEPRHTSRVALAKASVADLITELQTRASSERPDEYSNDYSNDDLIDFYEGDEADQDECDSDCCSRDEMQNKDTYSDQNERLLQLLTTMNVEMLLTGHSREVTSVHKTMDNSQVDVVKSADLVIDAECLYAFTGKCEWPEDNNNADENEENVEFDGERMWLDDDWLVSICEASEVAPMHAKTVKLLPGERMGGWSSLRFDRRVRMRALVRSAVNNGRASILLDTGANVSIITTKLVRRLRLEPIQEHSRQLEVQGIQEGKMSTTTRLKAKVTLGWKTVYEFEFWVMDHSAGSEVMLGTDFMIPAGIRLNLFNTTAKLPGEEMVPLVKSLSTDEDSAEGMHVTDGPTKSLQIPAGEWIEFRLQKRKPSLGTHDVWVRRTAALILTITRFRKGQPPLLRLTNITDRVVYCPAHLNAIAWVPRGFMPKQADYVPIDSRKYEQWHVLAYAGSHDETWFKLECELYERWLASQPPAVERQPYTWRTSILQRLDEDPSDGDDSLAQDEQWSMEPVARSVDSATDGSPVSDDPVSAAAALEHTFMCVMHVLSTEGNDDPADDDYVVHEANYIPDYAQELAFLPDLTEPSVTELNYTAPNVKNSSFIGDQQRRLDEVTLMSKGMHRSNNEQGEFR
ncbi:Eukaryotic/viral aspartic protease, partial [Phytophthora megakarya]